MGRLRREVRIGSRISAVSLAPWRYAGAEAFVTNRVTGLTPPPSSANQGRV